MQTQVTVRVSIVIVSCTKFVQLEEVRYGVYLLEICPHLFVVGREFFGGWRWLLVM
jgi:hypothetical protein